LSLGPEAEQEGLVLSQRRVEHLQGDPALQAHVLGDIDVG
jgi:hypothetical protein